MNRLDIVIVNWNAGHLLDACVASILASRCESFGLGDVVIVDNASVDGSIARLAGQLREPVRIVRSEHNLGFAKACNLGARWGSGELLLFLNPDTRLFPDSLEGAVRVLEERRPESVAVCGVRLIDESGATSRGCARLPNWQTFVVAALGLDRLFPGRFRSYVMTDWDHETSRFVDHVIGAFYLVRRSVFDSLGGFDERFFVYLEDLDFSHRIRERGLKTLYCAEVCAYHMGGGSSRAILARRLFYALRSRLQYARKHLPTAGAACVIAATLFVEPVIRVLHAVFTARLRDAWNVCRAYGMLYACIFDRVTHRSTLGSA